MLSKAITSFIYVYSKGERKVLEKLQVNTVF